MKSILLPLLLVATYGLDAQVIVRTDSTKAGIDQKQFEISDVRVSSPQFRITAESPVSLNYITRQEIILTPGANRDISLALRATPGVVAIRSANRNDLLVRGGGANENKYFIDGIEIPLLNHFSVQGGSGGYASLVNTELLQSVNFYTAAFPVTLASGLSSVLEMEMSGGNKERFHGKVIVGTSDAGLHFDTPLTANGKVTMSGSYRRSYLGTLFTLLKLPFLPTYNDYQFKISAALTPRSELYFIGLGSADRNRLNTGQDLEDVSREYILGYMPENRQSSHVFGLGYRYGFQGGRLQITASRDNMKNVLWKHQNNDEQLPRNIDISSRETNHRLRATVNLWDIGGFRVTAGAGVSTGAFRGDAMQSRPTQDGAVMVNDLSNLNLVRYEAFANVGRYLFDNKLSLMLALRMDGMNYSSHTANPLGQLSPRLSILYKLNQQWSVSASVARYYQEPSYTTMSWKGTDYNNHSQQQALRYMAVNNYVVGVGFKPSERSQFRLEGFVKHYRNMPVSLTDSLPLSTGDLADYIVGDVPVRSVGRGRAWGTEFSYRNLALRNTVLNLSYTFFVSQTARVDKNLLPSSNYISSSWDVRHVVNLSAITSIGRGWVVGGKWSLTGGLPYTPYDLQRSSLIESWDSRLRPYIDNSRYNSMRSPLYHQLDLRIDKTWSMKGWKIGLYLDVQNAYNYKATGQDILMPERGADGRYVVDASDATRYKMQRVPNDIGGTILPSLGLIVEM